MNTNTQPSAFEQSLLQRAGESSDAWFQRCAEELVLAQARSREAHANYHRDYVTIEEALRDSRELAKAAAEILLAETALWWSANRRMPPNPLMPAVEDVGLEFF